MLNEYLEKRIKNFEILKLQNENIKNTINIIKEAFLNNNKILLCGNGGSASFCNHLAAEFISKFKLERDSYPAISLCSNNSIITAIANDYSYDFVFKRQLEGLAKKGDILIAYSTSGTSKNVLLAIEKAKELNLKIIFFTGNKKSSLNNFCDIEINTPSSDTAEIQEMHTALGHIICENVEKCLNNKKSNE